MSNSVMSAYQFRLLLARRNAEAAVQDLKAQLEKPAEKPKDTKDAKQNKKRVSEKQAAKAGLPSSVRPNKRPKALKDKEREKEEKEAEAEPEDAEFLGASDVPSPPSGSEDPLPDSALFSDLLDEAEAVFEDGSSEIEQLMAPLTMKTTTRTRTETSSRRASRWPRRRRRLLALGRASPRRCKP